jgi:predicted CXXCH cytochrome family protein
MGGGGSPCFNCHTGGSPGQGDVDPDVCDTCHGPGGAYDGVSDPVVGALNNWENIGFLAEATQSLIYELDGTLKSGKEKWCATCHDAPGPGEVVLAVDDFEGYASDGALSSVWIGRQDTNSVSLVTPSVPQGSKAMEVDVWWEKNTSKVFGSASRDYSPALNLDAADSVGFWLRVESTSMFSDIKIKLRTEGTAPQDWSIGTVDFNALNMQAGEWKWIHISRADFTNNSDGWTTVDRIQFRANENSGTSYHVSFWIDDVNFFKSDSVSDAPNVVRDDQTWGHYVTGHRFVCTTCHDPSSEHIDGNRKSIFNYIQTKENPTNFRFYNDPTKQMELPYNDQLVPGETGSFALCYQCHEESNFMTAGDAETLVTNFTDKGYIYLTGADNLHLIHLNMSPIVFNMTCVACHDPHGQANPAMTRYQMGDLFYFDFDGCEITDQADWHNPGINRGAAQTSTSYGPLCGNVCHLSVVPPKEPPCDSGVSPYKYYSTGNNGYYVRDYEYVSHAGNMDVGPICLTAGCHPVNKLHAAHFAPDPGPDFPLNETGCYYCHADARVQCADGALFKNIDPEGPPQVLSDTAVCDSCHGGDGP